MRISWFVMLLGLSACATRSMVPHDLPASAGRVVIERDAILVVFPRLDQHTITVNRYDCGASWFLGFETAADTAFTAGRRGEPFRLFSLGVFAEGTPVSMASLAAVLKHAGDIRACSDGGHFRTCADKVPGSSRIVGDRVTWRLVRTPAIAEMLARKPTTAALQINVNCEPPVRSRVAIPAGV